MSILGFGKVLLRLPRVMKNHGVKKAISDWGIKQSVNQVGKVPAVVGLISAPIGAAAGLGIPGTAAATAITTAAATRGIMNLPSIFMKAMKACPTNKDITIGLMK